MRHCPSHFLLLALGNKCLNLEVFWAIPMTLMPMIMIISIPGMIRALTFPPIFLLVINVCVFAKAAWRSPIDMSEACRSLLSERQFSFDLAVCKIYVCLYISFHGILKIGSVLSFLSDPFSLFLSESCTTVTIC